MSDRCDICGDDCYLFHPALFDDEDVLVCADCYHDINEAEEALETEASQCQTCDGQGRVPVTPGVGADGFDRCPDCAEASR